MAATSIDAHQSSLLALFAKSSEGRLKAGDLKKKLKPEAAGGHDASETDRALAGLIEQELIAVAGGPKEGHHPRKNATYRLTDQGKDHLRPGRPDISEELLGNQEAFILLQVFRAKEGKLTRSDLNAKLRSVAAKSQLEFDPTNSPGTIDFHLAMLVEQRRLIEQRKGNSVAYTLDPGRGMDALVVAKQHEAVSFILGGKILNDLLRAARGSAPGRPEEPGLVPDEPPAAPPVASPASLGPEEIAAYVERLRPGAAANNGLIPIHEVRRLVAEEHGPEAASHQAFDPLLKRMRGEGQLELIAISDNRLATQEQLDAAIPGLNETIFYIVVD